MVFAFATLRIHPDPDSSLSFSNWFSVAHTLLYFSLSHTNTLARCSALSHRQHLSWFTHNLNYKMFFGWHFIFWGFTLNIECLTFHVVMAGCCDYILTLACRVQSGAEWWRVVNGVSVNETDRQRRVLLIKAFPCFITV